MGVQLLRGLGTNVIGWLIDKALEWPVVYTVYQHLVRRGAVIERTLMREVQRGNGSRVLDLGCGAGLYAGLFGAQSYVGIDVSARYIGFARRGNAGHRFGVMDVCNLALRSQSMDQMFAVGLFHHLSDGESARTIAEACRVLRPRGRMIVVDLIPPVSPNDLLGRVLVRADRGRHVRDTQGYRRMLSAAFEVSNEYLVRTGPYDLCVFVLERETS